MLPRPYLISYSSEKGRKYFHEPQILALAKSVETFVMVSKIDMPTVKYWQNLGKSMDTAKEKIPKQCIIGDTCFTSLAIIGVK